MLPHFRQCTSFCPLSLCFISVYLIIFILFWSFSHLITSHLTSAAARSNSFFLAAFLRWSSSLYLSFSSCCWQKRDGQFSHCLVVWWLFVVITSADCSSDWHAVRFSSCSDWLFWFGRGGFLQTTLEAARGARWFFSQIICLMCYCQDIATVLVNITKSYFYLLQL